MLSDHIHADCLQNGYRLSQRDGTNDVRAAGFVLLRRGSPLHFLQSNVRNSTTANHVRLTLLKKIRWANKHAYAEWGVHFMC